MRKFLISSMAFSVLIHINVLAQTNNEPVDLGEIDVVDNIPADEAPVLYESFDPIDSGTSTITNAAIETDRAGDTNTTELLKRLPNVQMDINRNDVSQRDIQDIRPSDFTISGGNFYNNNIIIDGVQANSLFDVTNDNPANFNEVAGQTSQTLYVDPTLLESVIVRDSNVSAEFGDFTGGVVEFNLREPEDKYGMSASFDYHSDDLVSYQLANEDVPDDRADLPEEPMFSRYRASISVDIPVSEKAKLLAAYSRSSSSVDYQMTEAYGGGEFDNGDVSQNFLVKGVYDINENLKADAQITFSPYESEYERENRIDDFLITHSDGLAARLGLKGNNSTFDWQANATFSKSDSSREWEPIHYSWSSGSNYADWCTSSNCSQGGFGDLDQTQEDLGLNFKISTSLLMGEARFGGEYNNSKLNKTRLEDNFAYSRGALSDTISCPAGDLACIDDDIVLRQYSLYQAYDIDVDVSNIDVWGEYEREIAETVTVRGGVRLMNENFLDNTNISPRLTATWEFKPDWFLTVGANKYYGKNMLSYAVRSAYPDSFIYRRTLAADGTVGDWALYRHTRSTDYAQANLDTPYSDELTAALTIPTPLEGVFRLKAVKRENRDQFARSPSETVTFDEPTATSSTTRLYTITNDGKSDYKSLSGEWTGHYNNHAFTANVTWSDTNAYGGLTDYFDEIDVEALQEDLIYYNGEVISEERLYNIRARENFATPVTANFVWNTKWWNDRIHTSLGAYFRDKYETIDDTRENIVVEGESYDVYDLVERPSHININLNASLDVFKNDYGSGKVSVRVNNLLNDLPYTPTSSSSPYQQGRTIWLGVGYKY